MSEVRVTSVITHWVYLFFKNMEEVKGLSKRRTVLWDGKRKAKTLGLDCIVAAFSNQGKWHHKR